MSISNHRLGIHALIQGTRRRALSDSSNATVQLLFGVLELASIELSRGVVRCVTNPHSATIIIPITLATRVSQPSGRKSRAGVVVSV